jgi:hypothetical protein
MNRVLAAIERRRKVLIKEKGAAKEVLDKLHKDLDLSFEEYVVFQDTKSLAQMHGKITLEEAQTIYNYLGESGPDNFNKQPLEVKVVLTMMFQELMGWKIKISGAVKAVETAAKAAGVTAVPGKIAR